MIRRFIAIMRTAIIGPQLGQLASLDQERMNNLFLMVSDDPFAATLNNNPGPKNVSETHSSLHHEDLSTLKLELAALKERIDVLERINYDRKPPENT